MVARLNVAVTGSSGFIGNAVCDSLKSYDYKVIPIANRLQVNDFLKDLENDKFDVVIHCAGKLYGTSDELYDSNVFLTKRIVSSIPNGSQVRLIFMSTGAVYGNTKGPSSSELDENSPLDLYGQTKLDAEMEVLKYLRSTILRLPSVYGENNRKGLVFHILDTIKNQRVFSLENGGIARRSFLNISDLVFVIAELIRVEIYGIFNVSEPVDYSVKEIVSRFNLEFSNVSSSNSLSSMVLDSSKLSKYLDIDYSNVLEFIENAK